MKPVLMMAALVTATAATVAPKPTFDELDRNRDGGVSRDEALQGGSLLKRFSDLDTDHDGVLSSEEFAAFEAVPASKPAPRVERPVEKPVGGKAPDQSN